MRDIAGRDVAYMFGLGFVVPLIVGVAGMLAHLLLHNVVWSILGVSVAMIIVALVVWSFARRGWTRHDFGFQPLGPRGWHLVWQIPAGLIVSLVIAATVGAILNLQPEQEQPSTGLESFIPPDNILLGYIVVFFFAVIAGPIWEELVFRRFIMGWLDYRWNKPAISIGVSALLFAAIHMVPAIVVWTFLLGVWGAVLVRWHRSLWAGVAYHVFNNFLVTVGMGIALLTAA
ncbi:CPBP family intramembrane glutamic endopeptidase [Corynebacterium sp.]|uniref:CPBP family intramembrane glutamic endopeptidase n=1 Tax=Corynebacterium sp. TaxID=1720 RepID=UPI0026DCF3B8|nr:type II CAAX endopeptidase family protein [Corynebacterium sp.]MDO5076602.1 type II CAAX endopeptidase family protein [Corynebacterium sp.]